MHHIRAPHWALLLLVLSLLTLPHFISVPAQHSLWDTKLHRMYVVSALERSTKSRGRGGSYLASLRVVERKNETLDAEQLQLNVGGQGRLSRRQHLGAQW